jgi:tetratricopeptide (TPR) repeat protein
MQLSDTKETEQRVALLQAKGEALDFIGQYPQALTAYQQALEKTNHDLHEAKLRERIGTVLGSMETPEKGQDHFEASLYLYGVLNHREGMAEAHTCLGWMHYRLQDTVKARKHFRYAERIAKELDNPSLMARIQQGQGVIELADGHPDRAEDLLKNARGVFEHQGDRRRQAQTTGNLAILYGKRGDPQKQLEYYQQVLKLHEDLGDSSGLEVSHNNLGAWYVQAKQPEPALEHYQQLIELSRKSGRIRTVIFALTGLTEVYLLQKNPVQALSTAQEAHRLAQELPQEPRRFEQGVALRVLGQANLAKGDTQAAKDNLNQALDILKDLDPEEYAKAKQSLQAIPEQTPTLTS